MSKNKELLVEDLMLSLTKPANKDEDTSVEVGLVNDSGLKSFVSSIEKINKEEDKKFGKSKKLSKTSNKK